MRNVNVFKALLGTLAAAALIAGSAPSALASDDPSADRGPGLAEALIIVVNPVETSNPHDDWRQDRRSIEPVVGKQAEV